MTESNFIPSNEDGLMTNHPVHIVTNRGRMSPSAFIPFCELGGNMSLMGIKIDQFDVPVCNSFKARILNDQLCYELDVNKFIDKADMEGVNRIGLTMILDYNEERQISTSNIKSEEKIVSSLTKMPSYKQLATIHIDTTGEKKHNILIYQFSAKV